MIMHESSFEASFEALKKFGVFAKTDIVNKSKEWVFIGGKGLDTEALVSNIFAKLPTEHQVLSNQSGFVIRFDQPETRYLVALSSEVFNTLEIGKAAIPVENKLWQLMDIQAGIPHINNQTSAEFIPQMMNLQALDAISFTKGCYMGQETIARNKYLGKNKRASFILMTSEKVDIKNGDLLERQVGENWRRGGTVLSSSTYNSKTWILAVLPNDTNMSDVLRLKDEPNALFEVQPLPYSLEE
jgi:folate-binding protein YgfZ